MPYDSGFVFVRDGAAHRAAMGVTAAYLTPAPGQERDPFDWVPELSRRGRGFVVYAALRELGAAGVADDDRARLRPGDPHRPRLAAEPGVRMVNEVVLNQVLFDVEATRP